jgi:hypothetical protein
VRVRATLEAAAAQAALQPMRKGSHEEMGRVGWLGDSPTGDGRMETDGPSGGQVEGHGGDGIRIRDICFRILDPPSIPFTSGVALPANPHSEEDMEF